jgi:hypothetical protein
MKKRKRNKKSKEKIKSEEVLKRFMAHMDFATKLKIAQEDRKKDLEK